MYKTYWPQTFEPYFSNIYKKKHSASQHTKTYTEQQSSIDFR